MQSAKAEILGVSLILGVTAEIMTTAGTMMIDVITAITATAGTQNQSGSAGRRRKASRAMHAVSLIPAEIVEIVMIVMIGGILRIGETAGTGSRNAKGRKRLGESRATAVANGTRAGIAGMGNLNVSAEPHLKTSRVTVAGNGTLGVTAETAEMASQNANAAKMLRWKAATLVESLIRAGIAAIAATMTTAGTVETSTMSRF